MAEAMTAPRQRTPQETLAAKRHAALRIMDIHAKEVGAARDYREEREAGIVRFIGTKPDGSEFSVGYEMSPREIAAHA